MNVALVRVTPKGIKGELNLTKARTVFGRGDEADVRVPVSKISRTHCAVSMTEAGDLSVEDLGSSNGTFVNQEKISSRPLAGGDLLCIGGIVFVVRVNGDPDDIDAELMFEDGLPEEGESMPSTPSSGGHGQAPLVSAVDPDDSSIADFEFDLGEDDDDQPPL